MDGLEQAGHPRLLALLLARRGAADRETAAAFLRPTADQLHDPFLLTGMGPAVERLTAARADGERVAIVGDYDADGVTATALLTGVLRHCGLPTEPILPQRRREGYGFQPLHAERAAELGCRLIVTVDCGISAAAAVAAAHALGIDVIVTDHHLPTEALPADAVIINPRQAGCSYPFPDLAGVGLALKLGLALAIRLERPIDLAALLRVACLGTIADMAPLTGENRVIAALGLASLADSRSLGLQALFAEAGLRPPFRAVDVGFRIGPRLNAAGRLRTPDLALELLLTRDSRRARELAATLGALQRERQNEEEKVLGEIRDSLSEKDRQRPLIVSWSAGWHPGVLGLAAGRLARELNRPTILFSVEGDRATGSGRSVAGFPLHEFLAHWRERTLRFGGHALAVGLTVETHLLPALGEEWEAAARAQWPAENFLPALEYELDVTPDAIDLALLDSLEQLEPHGEGNPRPLLRVGPLAAREAIRDFGKGHLRLWAGRPGDSSQNSRVELLGWGWASRRADLGREFEVVAHLTRGRLHGGPVLELADARPLASE